VADINCAVAGGYCTFQGRQQWSVKMPANITALEVLDHSAKSILGLLVALSNREVHTYVDKTHVDTMVTEDVVTAMKFGRFGREESTLVMVTQGQLCTVISLSEMLVFKCSSLRKLFTESSLALNFCVVRFYLSKCKNCLN